MLAEPRRKKVKRSNDPQNLLWSSDKEKFGYKMLEKMGWREGEGLGISKTGITKHISVSVKSDNKGLGADSNFKYYDWQGEFNNVLKSMN
ncbi:G patch domain-containing protein, partial [Salmonella sp. s51228]|uniref:G patch domain-containing protein n=1 Tax=Salmonella sp. s51228 TaxID=3159652 RepID=UPI00397EF4DA